ncbi:unnamed protein product [Discosporangium mesarthrocarpum]
MARFGGWVALTLYMAQPTLGQVESMTTRSYDGTSNNAYFPMWGAAGTTQLRSVAAADYTDGFSDPPGSGRPTAREVLSEVFLAAPASGSPNNAMFVAWGMMVGFDLVETKHNQTESLDIPCDGGAADVWCPFGLASEPIPFFRSQAEEGLQTGTRDPINFATAYLDLDFVYGRDQETADSLRTKEGGMMILTEHGMPVQMADSSWLLADQRTAMYPLTFALHTLLLREHNSCCVSKASGFDGVDGSDESFYQACRAHTIAVYQHITENDFVINLLGTSIGEIHDDSNNGDDDPYRLLAVENTTVVRRMRRLNRYASYSGATNAGVDVFFSTVVLPGLLSGLPSVIRLVDDDYAPIDEDLIPLHKASADLAGIVARHGLDPILRGGVFSKASATNVAFAEEVSNASSLFALPVMALQRGRDHGVPSYNDAREAYGLERAESFADITGDITIQGLLSGAYGGDVDLIDALAGALAEGRPGHGLGPLLQAMQGALLFSKLNASYAEQLLRTREGDSFYHNHSRPHEMVEGTTFAQLMTRNSGISFIPPDAFSSPQYLLTYSCSATTSSRDEELQLSGSFKVRYRIDEGVTNIEITLIAKGVGEEAMLGIGFGGHSMITAQDFVLCEVKGNLEEDSECTDRSSVET